MTCFSLPQTNVASRAAFCDSASATDWLSRQPQANASAMLDAVFAELQIYNRFFTPARERFRTMEVLRKTVFAVNNEIQRRFENKPLPLLPAEQSMFIDTRQLWRACAVGYLHCLQACLAQDEGISSRAGRVAHRALTCLRMEQLCCYAAGHDVDGEFWRNLHAVYASSELLGVLAESVKDSLPCETLESTVNGQYTMALLLHLAKPFSLTRSQFAAAVRWFARWREQAVVQVEPPVIRPKSCDIALDLAQDQAIHDRLQPVGEGRWLVLDHVLRKIRKRIEALHAGSTPEHLKLGNSLSVEACITLLEMLSEHLRFSPPTRSCPTGAGKSVEVVFGLNNLYRLLGGKNLEDRLHSPASVGRLQTEQLAVFGHVLDAPCSDPLPGTETWHADRQDADCLELRRDAATAGSRLLLRSLLGIRASAQQQFSLATISQLWVQGSEVRFCTAPFPGNVHLLVVEQKIGVSGKRAQYPAMLLTGGDGVQQVILPAGLNPGVNPVRIYEGLEYSLLDCRLRTLIERAGDYERWSVAGLA